MDPNAALLELRQALAEIEKITDCLDYAPGESVVLDDALLCNVSDAIDRFRGLDGWLCHGGFPPAAWEPYCNHDAVAVTDGVCECGAKIVAYRGVEA